MTATRRRFEAVIRSSGRRSKRRPILDLQDDTEIRCAEPLELRVQPLDVAGFVNERQRDEIAVSRDERQVLEILAGQSRELERRVRQVDAFFGLQRRAAAAGALDLQPEPVASGLRAIRCPFYAIRSRASD
jgi:hypothetical protein